ncbi:RidA family protein [Modestobacter sp. URMC 112]
MTAPVHTDVPGMLPGLFPYSLAVRLGDTVRTAGIVGIDYTSGRPSSLTDFRTQVRATMDNLVAVLTAAGTGPVDVVETSCYLTDMGRWDEFNAVYSEYFTPPMPIRTTISCGFVPPYLVEVSAVAWSPRT